MPQYLLFLYILLELIASSFAYAVAIGAAVVQGLGFMKIAQKVGVKNGWMAFIPYANCLLLGHLAEESDRRAYPDREPRKWGRLLLTADIILTAGIFVLSEAVTAFMILHIFRGVSANPGCIEDFRFWLPVILAYALFIILLFSIMAVYEIMYYLVIYRVYRMMAGWHAAWMIVVSIFAGAAVTVFAAILGFSKKYPLQCAGGAQNVPSAYKTSE